MNKTIKVIDLLNKIANSEVVPKTILFYDKEYKLDDEHKCYMHKISEDIFDDFMDNNNAELDEFLNDTVEIIEDNDKLEKINNFISNVGRVDDSNIEEYIHKLFQQQTILYFKINGIINHINKIEERLENEK